MNSDPKMIETFLKLFRIAFTTNESKFRALVHIHEYHNGEKQRKFWSELTKIPINQFSKNYLKPHTKKRIRDGYQGCIRIRYYDATIALELRTFYNTLAKIT